MKIFAGIDVSKLTLSITLLSSNGRSQQFEVSNNSSGHQRLLQRARNFAKGANLSFCMEATGPYHWALGFFLVQAGERVSVENPRRIKHYGLAIGAIQKTDRADSAVIAKYAATFELKAWHMGEPHRCELVLIDRRITELLKLRNQESNRLEMVSLPALVAAGIQSTLALVESQIKALEQRIEEILRDHQELERACTLLTSIPGIARRAAVGLLVEVGDIDAYDEAQDLAAKLGLQPILRRSGTSLHGRSRISKAGNAHARGRLYMPTVVAIRANPIIRDFYTKLIANHKPKKAALIACERKLVMICYGVLKGGKPFDPNHSRLIL